MYDSVKGGPEKAKETVYLHIYYSASVIQAPPAGMGLTERIQNIYDAALTTSRMYVLNDS